MSDFDISYNLNYGSMARGKQQVDPWVQPSLVYTSNGLFIGTHDLHIHLHKDFLYSGVTDRIWRLYGDNLGSPSSLSSTVSKLNFIYLYISDNLNKIQQGSY